MIIASLKDVNFDVAPIRSGRSASASDQDQESDGIMTQKLKAFFSIVCMIATSIVTLATSKSSDHDLMREMNSQEVYLVASSCPGALAYDKVTIQNKEIISPTGRHPGDFGLPSAIISFHDEDIVSGWLDQKMRTCRHALVNQDGTNLNVFTCSEDGAEICKVSFELDAVQKAL
jgi:hypothetical protein